MHYAPDPFSFVAYNVASGWKKASTKQKIGQLALIGGLVGGVIYLFTRDRGAPPPAAPPHAAPPHADLPPSERGTYR